MSGDEKVIRKLLTVTMDVITCPGHGESCESKRAEGVTEGLRLQIFESLRDILGSLRHRVSWIATDNLDTSEPLIILVFIFSRWHLIARTMPTLTVIKHFDVIKNIAAGFFTRSVDLFLCARTGQQLRPDTASLRGFGRKLCPLPNVHPVLPGWTAAGVCWVSRYWLHLYALVGFDTRPEPLSRHALSAARHG